MTDRDDENTRVTTGSDHDRRLTWLLKPLAASVLIVSAQAWSAAPPLRQESQAPPAPLVDRLAPTHHPTVPPTLEAMWYAPPERTLPEQSDLARLARGVRILDEAGDTVDAFTLVSAPGPLKTDVADYARYYTAVALQRLNRLDEADALLGPLANQRVQGQLPEAALYRQAEIREARADFAGAAALYSQLLERTTASPSLALVKLGAAASAAGDRPRAIEALRRVLREHPLSPEAVEAESLLSGLDGFTFDTPTALADERDRAEALFKARRWDQARNAYERLRSRVESTEGDRITLRLAQIQVVTGNARGARDVFRRFAAHDTLGREAQYGLVVAARVLNETDDFRQLTNDFAARFPTDPLAEEALNELARHYILEDEDERAADAYARLVERFPAGALAERAAWRAGWWAYRQKNYRETIRLYEHAAATFPRSDYRPSWLYWSARAHDHLGDRPAATARYRLAVTDYLNTYYGRLAWRRLDERQEATVTASVRRTVVTPPPPPANLHRIARLIEVGLYRPALNELQYAQKMWGDSPPLQATIAFAQNRLGSLRLGITAMKRAYPQHMAAGGEGLPVEILRVLFPIDYWPLLKGHAEARGLDPFVVAALVAQESTFDAVIRSSANAVGLMQVLPSTGRRYARKIGIRGYSERSLANPEINVRIGMQYYTDLVNRFGGNHLALASYNAGESRVQRWLNEAPNLPEDEFIDSIPFPETQNYVKRILGAAEDYRRLYGDGSEVPTVIRPASKTPARITVTPKRTPTAKAPARKAPTRKAPARKAPATKPNGTCVDA